MRIATFLLTLLTAFAAVAADFTSESFTASGGVPIFSGTLDKTLDFWTSEAVIDPAGGYHFWFDADGNRIAPCPKSPDAPDAAKPIISHLRVLFAHAVAIPRAADPKKRARLRRQYEHGFAFLLRYRDPQTGLFVKALGDGGAPHDRTLSGVSQVYAIMMLSEIYASICDRRALDLAAATFAAFDRAFHDDARGGYVETLPVQPDAAKGVGTNLHAMLALSRLLKVRPSELCRTRLEEIFALLSSGRTLHDSGHVYMTMTADWKPAANTLPPDRQVLYGHSAEMVTYLLEAAKALRVPPETILPTLRKIAAAVIADGIAPDGAVKIYGPIDRPGEATDEPRWWCQLEAMNMLLRLYDVTGEAAYFKRFQQVAAFGYRHLVNPANGVWYNKVNLKTGRRYTQGGEDWKSGAHVIQSANFALPILKRHAAGWRPPRRHELKLPKRSIQISLGFPYNNRRSAASLVSEAKVNGYDTIFLILKEKEVLPEGLVEEAKKEGLQVYGSFFGPGTFMPDKLFGPESQAWRMEFTAKRGMRYFSYVHDGYRQWWKTYLNEIYDRHPFDGFVFYESYYGTRAGRMCFGQPPYFGDVSSGFIAEFQKCTGRGDFPNFTDPASPDYYLTDRELYADYVEFRIKSIVDFHREIWDGDGGLRQRHPEVTFATWTIALAGDGAIGEMREFQAQDGARLVSELTPDYHFFQSHWPDWMPEQQPPTYVKDYAPYVKSVRSVYPALPLAVQGDYASTMPFRRSPEWVRAFEQAAAAAGFDCTTFYELSVRSEVYYQAPKAVEATLNAAGAGRIVFDQVVAADAAQKLIGQHPADGLEVTEGSVDGNWINFKVSGQPQAGTKAVLKLDGIADEPSVRVKMPKTGVGHPNVIPAGSTIACTIGA